MFVRLGLLVWRVIVFSMRTIGRCGFLLRRVCSRRWGVRTRKCNRC